MPRMTFADAVRHGLAEEMRRDPLVWALGEDLSSAHGSTSAAQYVQLQQEFGPRRIVDTPISESTIMGAAVGAALAGTRPVAELRFADFGLCAVDELVNQAAKIRYMSGGQARVPLVVRQSIGTRRGMAAQHSQSTEAWFASVPGLVVVTPTTPADGRGLLKAAIRCDDPVVFMEHKDLWLSEGEVDLDDEGLAPLGRARIVRKGTDLTIVAWSRMVLLAQQAAETLAEQGIEAPAAGWRSCGTPASERIPPSRRGDGAGSEVLDLRTIWPWDREAVMASVRKTRRLLVAQETVLACGFAGEVVAEVAQHEHARLLAPPTRLGAPRMPVPYAAVLEDECRIEAAGIARAAHALCRGKQEVVHA